jgi:hypothetical protein
MTYLTWDVTGIDGKKHKVVIYLDADPVLALDTADQEVIWGRVRAGSLTLLNAGPRDQRVLERSGDNLRIGWGYLSRCAGWRTSITGERSQ